MKTNLGTIDRMVRILIAVVIGLLYFTGAIPASLAIVLGILALVFLVTAFVGFCPLYLPFGLSTKKKV